jgi:hypothetical protein
MTPQEKATELVEKFIDEIPANTETDIIKFCEVDKNASKQCALIAVQYIITSNPHSNPFNTDVHSTMDYWEQVKNEIEKL